MGATSISALKKAREAQSQALRENLNRKSEYATSDDRYWRPKLDDAGTGYAVIRFLPPSPGEELPYVTIYQYSVKGPGGWYIEKSLQTIGKEDPMNEYSRTLWANKDSMSEVEKQYARNFNRRQTFVSNILVVKDPATPENEGKVFLFGYGAQIMEKIKAKESPEFEDDTPYNPFDFWEGAPLKLKIRQKGEGNKKFPNYELSEFDNQSALFDGDEEKLDAIWKQQHKLQSLIAPSEFKTYEQLLQRMNKVLKLDGSKGGDEDGPNERGNADEDGPPFDVEDNSTATAERGGRRATGNRRKRTDSDAGEDEAVSFVKGLADRA